MQFQSLIVANEGSAVHEIVTGPGGPSFNLLHFPSTNSSNIKNNTPIFYYQIPSSSITCALQQHRTKKSLFDY